MRRAFTLIVVALLLAGAAAWLFKDRIWPPVEQGPRHGAGGKAGDNLGKKRGGG